MADGDRLAPVIDAHQHFWRHGTYQTSWMDLPPYAGDAALGPLRRDFGPDDLAPLLRAAGVDGTVVVEAADAAAESATLLATASSHDWIRGVVGWLPLDQPSKVGSMLEQLRHRPKFVGVRHLVNVEPDPDWIIRPRVLEGLRLLEEAGLSFDFVGILPRHLELLPRVAERLPNLRIVLDHLGKPPVAAGGFEPWATRLAEAARAPNVFAKLSGLDAASPGVAWSSADVQRYVDHAVAVFGPHRLMLGSDWPVAVLRGGYLKVWAAMNAALDGLAGIDRALIRGGTAMAFYRLPETP